MSPDFRTLFEQTFKQYYRKLYFFAFNFLEDEEAAKDVVNEAFCDIWEQREKRGSIVTPSLSLLYTIVRNKSVDYLRRRNSEQNYRDAYLLEVCTEVEAESCEEHE